MPITTRCHNMVRLEFEIGLYNEHFEKTLKWYNLAFKDRHPSKEDKEVYELINTLVLDMRRQDEEEVNSDD